MAKRAGPQTQNRLFTQSDLTYASPLDSRFQSNLIRSIEWLTGKLTVIRNLVRFERRGGAQGAAFWSVALDAMGITIATPSGQFENIPKSGPVVVVANHPCGTVDGMVLATLIAEARSDFAILTREFPSGLAALVSSFVIPVPFPHDADALEKGKAMRARAMEVLEAGGAICLFPSGQLATSATAFGPVEEANWNVFTAQMIRKSGAAVVPVFLPGQASRLYQIANRLSPTLPRALLMHEVARASNRAHAPVIGAPLTEAQMTPLARDPRGWIAWLRDHTLSLGD